MRRILVPVSLIIFLAAAGIISAEEARGSLSLADCLKLARENHPSQVAVREAVESARYQKYSTGTGFLPTLGAEYSRVWLDEAPSMSIPTGNPAAPTLTVPMGEKVESSYTLKATEPLTNLLTILVAYKIKSLGVDLARIQAEAAAQDLDLGTAKAYYGLLRAQKYQEVAQSYSELVQAHVSQARDFFRVGVIPKNDLLTSEVKLADVQQNLVRAEHAVKMARAGLNSLLGFNLDAPTRVEEVAGVKLLETPEAKLEEYAADKRPEMREINTQLKQAELAEKLTLTQMLPDSMLQASVTHQDGVVGDADTQQIVLGASWDFWQWGKKVFDYNSARHDRRRVLAGRDLMLKQVQVEVHNAYLEMEAATRSIAVGEKAIEQAEENLRIIQKSYEVNAVTSADVLDAQAALTQAKLNYYAALYDHYLAVANLRRAVGLEPTQEIKGDLP